MSKGADAFYSPCALRQTRTYKEGETAPEEAVNGMFGHCQGE